jgi:hypothetical protein
MPLAFFVDSTDARTAIKVLEEVISQGEGELGMPFPKTGLRGFQSDTAPPEAIRMANELYAIKKLRQSLMEGLLNE